MNRDFLHFVSFFVPVCAFLALLVVAALLLSHGLHPFTAIGRAKLARRRELRARQAELIRRGFSDDDAERLAKTGMEDEAHSQSRALRALGVEP